MLCLALVRLRRGWLSAMREQEERGWRKGSAKTLLRKKNESSASPKKLKEGGGDMNTLTKRRQGEGLAREWKI